MKRKHLLLAGILFTVCVPGVDAQFIPAPFRIGFGGIGVSMPRPYVYGYGGVYPVGGFVPYPPVPFGVVERRVTVQIVTPPIVVVHPRVYLQPVPEFDLSGVDLDVVRLPTAAELAAGKPLRAEPLPPPRPKVEIPKKEPAPKKDPPPKKPVPPKKTPKLSQSDVIELGMISFQKKKYGLAALRFRHAAGVEAPGHRSHFLLAQSWLALGKYEHAVRAIEAGMDRRPDWPTNKFSPRRELYQGNEQEYEAHLKRLQQAVAQNPKRSDLLFLLAYQYWFDGRKDEAAGLFRRARALTMNGLYIDRFLQAAKPGQVAAN